MDGVVRIPSAFSMTFGVLPSMTATHEFVVPRSIPMTLPMVLNPLSCGRLGRPPQAPLSPTPLFNSHKPLAAASAAAQAIALGSYRREPCGCKTVCRMDYCAIEPGPGATVADAD